MNYENLRKRKLQKVEIEYDNEVYTFYLRTLNAREWMEITSTSFIDEEIQPEAMARYVAYSLTDENGNPIMNNEEGVVKVSEWPYTVVKTLFEEIQKLNGFFSQR